MTTNRYISYAFGLAYLLLLGVLSRGCIYSPDLGNDGPANHAEVMGDGWGSTPEEVIEHLVIGYDTQVISPRLIAFGNQVEHLKDMINRLDEVLARGDDPTEAMSNARAAWATATMTWQTLIFIMVDAQRSELWSLYRYPHSRPCRIEGTIASEGIITGFDDPYYVTLDMIEYVRGLTNISTLGDLILRTLLCATCFYPKRLLKFKMA